MEWFVEGGCARLVVCVFFLSMCGCATSPGTGQRGVEAQLQVMGEEICQEVRSGTMWQVGKGGVFESPEEAVHYAANLNLAGYDDWRLPTREEMFGLYTIFYWEKNGSCAMNRKGNFWSLSEEGELLLGHWETYFLCAPEHKYVKSLATRGLVRAVRP